MSRVDSEAYKIPAGYSTLANSYHLRNELTEPHQLNDLPRIAKELGFSRVADFPTKRAD